MDRIKEDLWTFVVICYVILTGAFFGVVSALQTSIVTISPPGKNIVLGISVVFLVLGVYYFFQFQRGQLNNEDAKTVRDIRREAVEKLNDPAQLMRISKNSPFPEVREAAVNRLNELAEKKGP